MTIARDNQQCANTLNALGASAALAYLNAGVPHRYSAQSTHGRLTGWTAPGSMQPEDKK